MDVIAVLTESDNPQVYWRVFKKRLLDEGADETVTKCNALKMVASDGKRALKTYLKKGYSLDWINQRLKSIEIRKVLTDELEKCGVKEGKEFAILTDEMVQAWAGLSTREYKNLKDLKKRKSSRQHDQPVIGLEYVGRLNDMETKKTSSEFQDVSRDARLPDLYEPFLTFIKKEKRSLIVDGLFTALKKVLKNFEFETGTPIVLPKVSAICEIGGPSPETISDILSSATERLVLVNNGFDYRNLLHPALMGDSRLVADLSELSREDRLKANPMVRTTCSVSITPMAKVLIRLFVLVWFVPITVIIQQIWLIPRR